MRTVREKIQILTILCEKCLNFFKFVGVLCVETPFWIQEFVREIVWFLKTWKFLKKIKTFEEKKWNIWKKIYELFEKTLIPVKLLPSIST